MNNIANLLLKSIDYKIGTKYSKLGTYFGIYNNSHLLFIDAIVYPNQNRSWAFYCPGIPRYVMLSTPTKNEVHFIINHQHINQIFPMFNYIMKEDRTYIITIDDLYYRPKLSFDLIDSLWIVNRIY